MTKAAAILINYNGGLQTLEFDDYFTIGRGEGNNLVLDGDNIIARHARIERTDKGYIIRDLRTPSGTFVNGTKIIESFLSSTDIITIGDISMSFIKKNETKNISQELRSSKNEAWNKQLKKLGQYGNSNHSILLLGESGTGKEIIAKALHQSSIRSSEPMITINCSAISETLIESELFGHVKGSFTGAVSDRKGAFELARGGTLFLDEIGDLPIGLQPKLLRAIENSEIWPIGSEKCLRTDVRIITATHPNLHQKVSSGAFRLDLFFRINTITVNVPKLTHRLEDFDDILFQFAREMRVRFSFHAMQRLKLFEWPGNIRQLRNLVARASVEYPGLQIETEHIEELLRDQQSTISAPNLPAYGVATNALSTSSNTKGLSVLKEIEREVIKQRLMANNGNQKRTAVELGMPKSTLHDRIRQYNIDPSQYRL